jgi:hypothetical protein
LRYYLDSGVTPYAVLGKHLDALIDLVVGLKGKQYRNAVIFYQHRSLRNHLKGERIVRKPETAAKIERLSAVLLCKGYRLCFNRKQAKAMEQRAAQKIL